MQILTATTTMTTAKTTIAANEQQQQQQQHQHIINCSYDNRGGDTQMQNDTHTTATTTTTTGHCHHHQGSKTTTPLQSRRVGGTAAHSHSHSHAHGHSHSNQASPFNSRHTSPHSHHSHSYHNSPHQSRAQLPAAVEQPIPPQQPAMRQPKHNEHAHHHHHHPHNHQYRRSRQRRAHSHSHAHAHISNCGRKHRSVTDVSSNSLSTSCRDVRCADRELRQLFTRKKCCSSSRAELAQYFAEDLYGSSSRRPSSCCTSSDYCYQTDSTSLYGSRSSHESIKSAHVPTVHKPRIAKPLRSRSQPTSQNGSLVSIYAEHTTKRKKKVLLSPSEITIERHTSKQELSSELPEYACSPSPIRWSFLGELSDEQEPLTSRRNGRKASTASEGRERERSKKQHATWKKSADELPHSSSSIRRKSITQPSKPSTTAAFDCNFEVTSDTVLFHQEASESYNNCCNNYIQCNTYLDQDLQITSEDIHQYLNKEGTTSSNNFGNGKNYPFQPTNALETQYKHNFADKIETGCGCKEQQQQQQQKQSTAIVSAEAHHSGYLSHPYPTYDYTNMSCNTAQRANSTTSNSNSDDQHSSLLQSPEPVPVSFESFDAASERKLLSPQTPHSESPCSSGYSVAINPSAAGPFVHHHHHHQHHNQEQQQQPHGYVNVNEAEAQTDYHQNHHHHHHAHHYQHQQHNNGDSFKLSHAFRSVRKRARNLLRKK